MLCVMRYAYSDAHDYYHIGNWMPYTIQCIHKYIYLFMYFKPYWKIRANIYGTGDCKLDLSENVTSSCFFFFGVPFWFVSDLELGSVVDFCSFGIQIVSFFTETKVSGIDGIKMTKTEKVEIKRIDKKHIEFDSSFSFVEKKFWHNCEENARREFQFSF